MRLLKIVPDNTNIGFVRVRHIAFAITLVLTIAALALVVTRGLNMGVDFAGGVGALPPSNNTVRSPSGRAW